MKNRRRKMLKFNSPFEEVTSNLLPSDIIENIISRLPVKSLLRFKSVSKSWYFLISDSKFARVHLRQSMNSDYKTMLMYSRFHNHSSFECLKLTPQNYQIESLEIPSGNYSKAKVLCSCDGLVLLKDEKYVLWNPSTRKYKKFTFPYEISYEFGIFGLCYDALNDDYKVVYVVNEEQQIENEHIWYAVYSYKNNYWIARKEDCLVGRLRQDPGLFVNGALHWVMYATREDLDSNAKEGLRLQKLHDDNLDPCLDLTYKCNYAFTYEMCCFDPRYNKFKKLSKPACFDISSIFQLTDLRGQLCLCRNTYDFSMVEIWTMKEYGDCNSWIKLLTIENVPRDRRVIASNQWLYVKPLCLTNENNCVLDSCVSRTYTYNIKDNKFDKIALPTENALWFIDFDPFLCWNDSLLLPNRIKKTKGSKVDILSKWRILVWSWIDRLGCKPQSHVYSLS